MKYITIYLLALISFSCTEVQPNSIEGMYKGSASPNNKQTVTSEFTIKQKKDSIYTVSIDSHITGDNKDVKTSGQYEAQYNKETKTLGFKYKGQTVEFIFSEDFKSFTMLDITYKRI